MKKLLPFFSLAVLLVACNSTPKNTATQAMAPVEPPSQTMVTDTAGLAQFQQWKVQNELRDAEDYHKPVHAVAAPIKKASKPKVVQPRPVPASLPAPVATTTASTTPQASGSEAGNESGTISSESGDEAKATKKEGISKAAKGAVIGGVAGAGAGAVINKKNRVVGAVVGAVIGAGGGYVLGRKMDKKDGRY